MAARSRARVLVSKTTMATVAALCALSATAVEQRDAAAQQTAGFAVDRFEPAPAGDLPFGVQQPTVDGKLRFNAALIADYAHAPLILRLQGSGGDSDAGQIVSKQLYVHGALSLAIADRILFSLNAPAAVLNDGGSPTTAAGTTFTSPSSAAFGDLRLGARLRILGGLDDPFQVAVSTAVWVPTGKQGSYVGDGRARLLPSLVLGGLIGDLVLWTTNVGVMLRKANDLANTHVDDELAFGASLGILAAKKEIFVGPEVYGTTTMGGGVSAFGKRTTSAEVLMGLKWRPSPLVLGIAGGPGINSGLGTPDYRLVGMIGYAPWGREEPAPPPPADRDHDGILDRDDACPAVPGERSEDPKKNGCPPDQDGDLIIDAEDACPKVAGVRDPDPKKNGCPPDKDGDGIVDAEDACMDVPGMKDPDPKKNGCPPDKDGDGITDAEDACADVPGVKDPDPKKNGCPPDKDGDSIVDPEDACPEVPGVKDPDPKKNGCPLVQLTKKAIVIRDAIHFEFNKANILADSDTLLTAIAQIFKDHPEIKKVQIEGHTDDKGSAPYNLTLSQKRADAVVKWLVAHGVDKGRLVSKGFGKTKPIADNATEEGREKNRRVEFNIVDPKPPTDEAPKP
jgi:OOP family OmpA-OmpF porin